MVPSTKLLSSLLALPALAFFSLSASALPHPRTASRPATLKLAVRINSYGIKNIAAADRARIRALQAGDSSFISATNNALSYTADIGVGSPPTYYTVLSVQYRTDSVSGEEYTDTVTLNSDLVIGNQSIGVALKYSVMNGLNGVLGLGPVDSTQGTVSNTDEVATVTDNLYEQGTISSEVLGVFFAPASSYDNSGELTFGGYDASKILRDTVVYVPVTSTYPASRYWGIDQSISYGSTQILHKTAGIVDTGTTLILIASDAFNKYKSATGGTLDEATGLLKISSDQYDKLSSLYFTIGNEVTYKLTPNAQIWPRSLNSVIGGTTDDIYLVVADIGSDSGWDFTNGYCFLERFYSVFDTTNSRVGFATTQYTYATTN